MCCKLSLAAGLIASAAPLVAQTSLGDLNRLVDVRGSAPNTSRTEYATVGGSLLFPAITVIDGDELFKTDGTGAGTVLVADIRPGRDGSSPRALAAIGNLVWFAADDGIHGIEPWVSDGTAAGTRLVADVEPGPDSSEPEGFVAGTAGVFFIAETAAHGREVWFSDGTPAGTRLSVDIRPGSLGSSAWALSSVGGLILLRADDGASGSEPWRIDESTHTAILLGDLVAGSGSSNPWDFIEFGGAVWFHAAGGPWRTDGTPGGTSALGAPGVEGLARMLVLGNRLLFAGVAAATGYEPYATDGTAAGTHLLLDIAPGAAGSSVYGLTVVGNRALFFGQIVPGATDLFATDGTPQGTGSVAPVLNPHESAACGGKLFWYEDEPWVSDGTPAGTHRLADVRPGNLASYSFLNPGFGCIGGRAVFFANDGQHATEPWISDGTTAGTSLLRDLQPPITRPSWGGHPVGFQGKLWFDAYDGASYQLYSSDGTAAGTAPLVSVGPSPWSQWSDPLAIGDQLFFSGYDQPHGTELWKTDGTAAGTALVKDLLGGITSSSPRLLTEYRGLLYFAEAYNGVSSGFWRSDGTPAGTFRVSTITPLELAVAGDVLFLSARPHGQIVPFGLWTSDGTMGGTVEISADHWPAEMTDVGGTLLFAGRDPQRVGFGGELWRSDGTSAGTTLVRDIHPTSASFPRSLTPLGARVLFTADDGVHGIEPWVSDGTSAGTRMLADLQPGAGSSEPAELTRAFDRWFFSADDGASGRELYVTDGTSAGTVRVADVCAGVHDGVGTIAPCGVGRLVVFEGGCANDIGLWVSDGTPGGTRRVADAVPGTRRVDVAQIATAGDTTYYAADDGSIGTEPYAIPLRALGGSQAEPYGAGCPGSTGVSPRIVGVDVPFAGNASFAVELSGVRAGAAAIAMVGLGRASSPYPGGCRLYIARFLASTAVVVADASGIATFPIPVPANPALIGASVYFQGVMDDPGGAFFGLGALSDGLHVVVGS